MSERAASQGEGRVALLVSSPRVVPGLLSRDAWHALDRADQRFASASDEPLALAVADQGLRVEVSESPTPDHRARQLVQAAAAGQRVVWLGSADGDPGLREALAAEVSASVAPPDLEVIVGSWDVQGARLLDAVAVMDRLRSPGGCPWDAEQTHQSLVPYLHEEAEEVAEAIAGLADGSTHLEDVCEELGDVLLQVLFHARVAQDAAQTPFDIDDVAGTLVAKLVRRHPHVFGDSSASTPAEVEEQWERIKAQEKVAKTTPRPSSPTDG